MAEGDFTFFDAFGADEANGTHDLDTHTFKVGIITNAGGAPSQTQTTPAWGDFSANEVTTTANYSAGGPSVGVLTLSAVGATTTIDWTTDVAITGIAGGDANAYWGILYNDTAAGDPAVGFIDLGGPKTMVSDLNINGPLWDKVLA